MKKVRIPEPEGILTPTIGRELAAQVVSLRNSRARLKKFDAYRAKLTLAVFQRASDPKLAAWEYVNRDANKANLTIEYLRACVNYDELTGIFTARLPSGKRNEGEILGNEGSSHGYLSISVAGRSYLAHRLAWFYVHGEWPEQIDHIDLDRRNNRIGNLRACNNQENNWNKKGAVGASWSAPRRKWVAKITHNSQTRTLGYFSSKIEAQARYREEVRRLRGYFLGEAA